MLSTLVSICLCYFDAIRVHQVLEILIMVYMSPTDRAHAVWYTALLRCCLFGGTTLKVSSILSEEHFLHLVEMARIARVVTQEENKTFQVSSHSSVKLGVDVKAEKVASR